VSDARASIGLKSALEFCKFLGAGERVSIAHVVGATHFPGGGGDQDPARKIPPKFNSARFTAV
jgi:hypothetical protein